jgi:rare lipoprotein A
VVVEVNDRGPFAKHRVIDLSRAAAQQIGLIQRGHTKVQLEVIG